MNNCNKSVLLLSNRVRDEKMLQSGWVKTPQWVLPSRLPAVQSMLCVCIRERVFTPTCWPAYYVVQWRSIP